MHKILDHSIDELSITAETADLNGLLLFLYILATKHLVFQYTTCFLHDGWLYLFC